MEIYIYIYIYGNEGSSHSLYVVKFYCNMFGLMYKSHNQTNKTPKKYVKVVYINQLFGIMLAS